MNTTANTILGIITAMSGILIALITSWVSRRKDTDGVMTRREEAISKEMWGIINELKSTVKELRDDNNTLNDKVDALEKELRDARSREFALVSENTRMSNKILDLELLIKREGD